MACNCLNYLYIRFVKNHTRLKYFVIYLFLKGVPRTGSMHFPIHSGLEVIKLENSLRLKIKRNDWLLADMCPQAANHCALF